MRGLSHTSGQMCGWAVLCTKIRIMNYALYFKKRIVLVIPVATCVCGWQAKLMAKLWLALFRTKMRIIVCKIRGPSLTSSQMCLGSPNL
jgi:hypothetical protein